MRTKISILVFITVIIASCTSKKPADNTRNEKPVIKTAKVEESNYIPVLTFSGSVKAFREANLGAVLPGRIEKLYFEEGDNVKAGDIIAEMSAEMLMQAQAENTALKKDFERLSHLKDKGSVSDMNYDHVKAQYEASDAKVAMLKKNTQIKAPFSGIIAAVNVKEGENFSFVPTGLDLNNLSLASGIVKLMQVNPIKIEIEIGEKDLSKIKIGQAATITLDAYPEKKFTGKVHYIKPVLSGTTHTATVEIEVSNPGMIMKPGMYAGVTITAPAISGMFIPSNAILKQEGMGEEFVYVLVKNTAHRINIKRVYVSEDKVAVVGLQAGQEVITYGKNKLSEGTEVSVKND